MTVKDYTVPEFLDRLDTWADDVIGGDHFEFLEDCKVPIAEMFTEIFATAVDSQGNAWVPHAPSTVARYGPHPLLILYEAMYGSLTGQSEHHYESITENSLEWGTTVVYAAAQNYGTERIPPREFMYFNQSGADAIQDLGLEYLEDLIGQF